MIRIAGDIYTNLDLDRFASMLIQKGIRTRIHLSSFYESGAYVRIEEGATEFLLENIGAEYHAIGYASSFDLMYQAASKVSHALITLDVEHVFELYDESGSIIEYLHHNRPQSIDG